MCLYAFPKYILRSIDIVVMHFERTWKMAAVRHKQFQMPKGSKKSPRLIILLMYGSFGFSGLAMHVRSVFYVEMNILCNTKDTTFQAYQISTETNGQKILNIFLVVAKVL